MNIILLFISSIADSLYYNNFFDAFCKGRLVRKHTLFIAFSLYVIVNILINTHINSMLNFLIINICALFGLSCLYKIKIRYKICIILFLMLLAIFVEIIASFILALVTGVSVIEVQSNFILATIGIVISKSTTLTLSYIFKSFYKKKEAQISIYRIMPYVLMPIMSCFILLELNEVMVTAQSSGVVLNLFSISILVFCSNILFFSAFDYILKTMQLKNKVEFEKLRMESDRTRYEDILENQTQLAKRIHDIKNKMYGLKDYIVEDNIKALNQLDAICDITEKYGDYTGIMGVDSIINAKVTKAKQEDIKFQIHTQVYKKINIDIIDLCVIVGNLLDNAFDAMNTTDDKKIEFEFHIKNNYICILVKNKYNLAISNEKTRRKEEKILHGYGVKNVKEIVKKYGGLFYVDKEEKWFIVNAFIENR
ncbi:MAG: GHKL domain-containing protein [Bacillota bacterium]